MNEDMEKKYIDQKFERICKELNKQKKNWEHHRDSKAWTEIELKIVSQGLFDSTEILKRTGNAIEHL